MPKTVDAESIKQYRPISLCNVLYKVITKTVVIRLQQVMQILIKQNQSSFVPSLSISDNIIIAKEVVHTMKTTKSRVGCMAMKVDLEKAYDRIRGDFLKDSLQDAGLPRTLIHTVMNYVTSSFMQLLWNEMHIKSFKPTKGVRQGDPLSPYFFVIGLERLGHLIDVAVENGDWEPLFLSCHGPGISHLFFTNDLILFCNADRDNVQCLQQVLHSFCQCSGHRVNSLKTKILFSNNNPNDVSDIFYNILGYKKVEDLRVYLGVPLFHNKMGVGTFQFIFTKFANCCLQAASLGLN